MSVSMGFKCRFVSSLAGFSFNGANNFNVGVHVCQCVCKACHGLRQLVDALPLCAYERVGFVCL